MGWKRKAGIGCGGVALLVAVAAGAMLYLAPWVPPVVVAEPGPTGRRVDAMVANHYPGRGPGRRPAVLMLGGSEGGIGATAVRQAVALQAEGFSVLILSYHRAPGQRPDLELVPLELFTAALAWLRRQPEVDPARVGIVGVSKGAEAALLVATRDSGIRAVVAALPSSVVWQGASFDRGGEFDSSWSENGRPLDHLRYGRWRWWGDMRPVLAEALETLPRHPDAAIPIERAGASVLLICGEQDSLWPSCPMARQLQRRARAHGRPNIVLLAYADAGHAAFGQPRREDEPAYARLDALGGTDAGNNRARIHGWPRTIAFLKAALGGAARQP